MTESNPFVEFDQRRREWADGGMERMLADGGLMMTHDQLEEALGPAAVTAIADAGFVLVPRVWRERVFQAADRRAASASRS